MINIYAHICIHTGEYIYMYGIAHTQMYIYIYVYVYVKNTRVYIHRHRKCCNVLIPSTDIDVED